MAFLASIGVAAMLLMDVQVPGQVRQSQPQDDNTEARVDDIVVEGHRNLAAVFEAFVDQISAPPGRRTLALWDEKICVGAVPQIGLV